MKYYKKLDGFSLTKKFNINIDNIPLISTDELDVNSINKRLILEKLLEAHNLAYSNVVAGNITGRGFATNISTYNDIWSLGTNFNNTRNDISSICGERSAILFAYNAALIDYLKKGFNKPFDFKIKYLCMGTSIELDKVEDFIVPCEDCLSWLNTNRYFDDNTIIFGFENFEGNLAIHATKLINLLPEKNTKTVVDEFKNKKITITKHAQKSIKNYDFQLKELLNLLNVSKNNYENIDLTKISNQNACCSVFANKKIYTSNKIDWTKRWFVEPLELASAKAVEENKENTKIEAIAYFGDEINKTNPNQQDGLISIKSLGRIRRKFASDDTILILNLTNEVKIMTISDYLPKKFIQGYKI